MGWKYHGRNVQTYKWVEVYACAEPRYEYSADDFITTWWVKHQGKSGATERFNMWAMHQYMK
jgi:hypothetical protein